MLFDDVEVVDSDRTWSLSNLYTSDEDPIIEQGCWPKTYTHHPRKNRGLYAAVCEAHD